MLNVQDSTPEEQRRKNRLKFDMLEDDSGGRVILNNDNTTLRQLTEMCSSKAKSVLNPIIEWSDADVWEFIENENLPYCELYKPECGGRKRLGCIGCPMNTHAEDDLSEWPTYRDSYLKTFDRMLEARRKKGLACDYWHTPEDVMSWWLGKQVVPKSMEEERQMMLEDFNNPYTEY